MRATCQMNRMNEASRRIAGCVLTASLRLSVAGGYWSRRWPYGQIQAGEEGHGGLRFTA
jgi:hypothetical protein